MDTELARTFLTVIASGNFISAADQLHVSQSSVSTHPHSLTGRSAWLHAFCPQQSRHNANICRPAISAARPARHDIGVPESFSGTLVVGGRFGLWEEFLLKWLRLFRAARPEISVRAESALEPELMQGLIEGRMDIAVMYTPQNRPGLKREQLFEEKLVMVSTNPKGKPEPQPGYVYVDWGPEFYARHSACFPNFGGPPLTANIGWLGLQHVLENGGSGYFPKRIVQPHLTAKRLTLIRNAPEFSMPAYAVYPVDCDRDLFGTALEFMHRIANSKARSKVGKQSVTKSKKAPRSLNGV
jgi:LysR family transcriptional regulator, flagellar master operon regulator